MKTFFVIAVFLLNVWQTKAQTATAGLPRLIKNGERTQLLVNDKPFLILGGELGNSSASSAAYLHNVWPKLKQMNLNTLLAPVYWELLEPAEGRFDFALVDSLLVNARKHQLKLVLLWFGAWKNSMSCYAPAWVKTNLDRFPRATDKNGVRQEILSPFSEANLSADKKAFVALMQHLKQVDRNRTVIAIQVENEIGMLPDARTYDQAANVAFRGPVPAPFLSYLETNKDRLLPELKTQWQANGYKTAGSWETVFGKELSTDEIFMAWHYGTYVNELAAAGKAVYPLPVFVNSALNRPGARPGQYPSAGPLPHLMDVWKAAAPTVDVLAPDFYNPDFKHWCDLYTRASNPLLIPEIRFEPGVDAKAFFAFGYYNCLAFSPFSIESAERPETEPIGKAYKLLQQLQHLLTTGPQEKRGGFLLQKDSAAAESSQGEYQISVNHEYTLGWSPGAKNNDWPPAGGLLVWTAPDEFYVAGTGLVITFAATTAGKRVGLLLAEEGRFKNENWIAERRLNGDQTHQGRHIRIPQAEYAIQRVKLYTY